jgi:AraC-like DNA-binding protein
MDRHDVSENVTAEIVAQLHQEDLKVEQQFNCRGLTYWFDEKRKTAFCLVDAPDKKSLQEMHNHAHGEVSHQIIEVDPLVVESFLGRIEDPAASKNNTLNIINDPAFRTIMAVRKKINSLPFLTQLIKSFHGRIVKHNGCEILVSFESVTDAVKCAVEISLIKNSVINIGIAAGLPVSGNKGFFEETVVMAKRLSLIEKASIVLTSEAEELIKNENSTVLLKDDKIMTLTSKEENFLNSLFDFIEKEWKNSNLKVDDFNKSIGLSKTQLYRKMMLLIGISPNTFLKQYRLRKALELMAKKSNTLSEIAYDSGFNSLSYFSKCFIKQFGTLPSAYQQNHS